MLPQEILVSLGTLRQILVHSETELLDKSLIIISPSELLELKVISI